MKPRQRGGLIRRRLAEDWELYLFLVPAIAYLIIFAYLPMFGITIAFKDFKPFKGIVGSDWVGLKHFARLFQMRQFPRLIANTLRLSLYSLAAGFPLPILLALALNSCTAPRFKRIVQTTTYAPHFISTVVVTGMVLIFFAPSTGIVQSILTRLDLLDGNLMILMRKEAFPHLYVWSGVWTELGWGSIVYLSALSGVDPALHEAAIMDGASKLRRVVHIDLPCIVPTIVITLILRTSSIMGVGFEKVFLLQNSMNLDTSEIISTYVYKVGIQEGQYSFSTAVGLFNSVINFILLIVVNTLSRRMGETSLW